MEDSGQIEFVNAIAPSDADTTKSLLLHQAADVALSVQ